jgi:hypothetical protein
MAPTEAFSLILIPFDVLNLLCNNVAILEIPFFASTMNESSQVKLKR